MDYCYREYDQHDSSLLVQAVVICFPVLFVTFEDFKAFLTQLACTLKLYQKKVYGSMFYPKKVVSKMIILVLTKNNFSKNLRFWFGFKKVAKETLWSYFVTEKFTNQLLWKLLGTQKVSERMIMKVVVAPQSHYETVENFCVKIMKVMVASKSCREVIDSIRFLFLVKTYFAQPRSLNFFFSCIPSCFGWRPSNDVCLFVAETKIRNNTL